MQPVPQRIETDRLVLRAPEMGDWFAVNLAVNESFDDLWPWMGWAQARPSMNVTELQVMDAIGRWETGAEYRMYMIEKATGKFVGSTGYIRVVDGMYEIGYWCRKSMQGQGYVTEAVRALTDLALEIGSGAVIKCDTDNARSIAVAKKLGYSYEVLMVNDSVKADGSGPRSTMIFEKRK